jgi:geranylgeranyl pyrophosphate synthase
MSQLAPRPQPLPLLADALDRGWEACDLDPGVPAALWAQALTGPLDEFVRRPGKELRTTLCALGWTLGGGVGPMPTAVAVVIDALHAGSLIIDDLEDGAGERRGAPAFHQLYGDALAINSGNWLYFWALEQLEHLAELGSSPTAQLHLHRRALATLRVCHQGQALDLRARASEVEHGKLAPVCAAITRGKTAALAGFAMELAAAAAGATADDAAAIGGLGATTGTALQMLDDLGSLTRGRRAKGLEDLRGQRVTWPWAWLAEVADEVAVVRAQHRLRGQPSDDALEALADDLYAAIAPVGRRHIRGTFAAGLAAARARSGDHPALAGLAALFARMEDSYG